MSKPFDIHSYAPLAQKYGKRYGVPANVLLGLVDVETGGTGNPHLTSPAGAQGLTQFMPGTAHQYKVKPWDPASSIRGAAQYLHDLGYSRDAKHALGAYNGGPGNPQLGYANEVLKRADRYEVGSSPSYTGQGSPAPASALPAPQASSPLADIVTRPVGSVTAPLAPSFSAKVSQPAGYMAPPGAPAAQQPDLRAQLSQVLQADAPPPYEPSRIAPAQQAPDPMPSAGGLPKGNPLYDMRALMGRAAAIDAEHLPYKWGGGHGPTPAKPGVPLDCSGAVSRLFGVSPRVSGQYESFGDAGRGKNVTIYANGHHVLVEIAGRFWGTSASNPGGGAGWIPRSAISPSYLKNFVARHPKGM